VAATTEQIENASRTPGDGVPRGHFASRNPQSAIRNSQSPGLRAPQFTIPDPRSEQSRLLTRTFSALRYRDFRLLWIGAFTSTTGTWMQTVAQSWLVFSLTGSAFLLGFDSFLGAAPIILFSLFGGVIADRFPRRRVMIGSQILQMTFAFTLAALILFDRVEVWHIFVLSFLTGTAQAFSGPAYVSLLPTLVSRDDVPNAIAMNSMQFNLARMIGPVVAGFALVAFGAAACFAINGLSFVAVIIALSLMSAAAGTHVARQRKSVMDDLREGIRFVGRNRVLVEVSALGFVGMFLGAPFVTLLPVVAKEVFAEGPKVYSWLLAAYGVGSVLGAVGVAMWSDLRRKGVLALAMQVGFAVSLVAFAVSSWLPLNLVLAFLGGACVVGTISLYSSIVQLTTTDEMRGRVMSIFMLSFRGGLPLGSLLAGWIAQQFSVQMALAVNGAVLALISLAVIGARSHVMRT
jgi:MFS family permease